MNFSAMYSSLKVNDRLNSASEALAASNPVEKTHQKREILSSWQIQPIQQTEGKTTPDSLLRRTSLPWIGLLESGIADFFADGNTENDRSRIVVLVSLPIHL